MSFTPCPAEHGNAWKGIIRCDVEGCDNAQSFEAAECDGLYDKAEAAGWRTRGEITIVRETPVRDDLSRPTGEVTTEPDTIFGCVCPGCGKEKADG